MARTTLVLDDNLLRQMKKKAADEGRSLQAVANELIRRGQATPPRQSYRLKLQGWKAGLSSPERQFLPSLMEGKPEWNLLGLEGMSPGRINLSWCPVVLLA